MRKEKGITLIALIITIVVMLILVAVTLTIALGENGIIAKTQYAKQQQAEKLAKDKVQACLEFDSTGQVNITDTEGSLQRTGATVKSKTETEITAEMDGYTFTISKNGNIVSISENGGSTGGATTGETLAGRYYNRYDSGTENYMELTNNSFTFVRDGDVMFNGNCVLDAENKSATISNPDGEMIIDIDVLQNNKVFIFMDELFSTTMDGFDYELNGEYINGNSSQKWDFNNTTHIITVYKIVNGSWSSSDGSGGPEIINYFGYNGTYYADGEILTVTNNNQTFSCDEGTFTKVVE